jgi:hypothetical protein
MGRKFVSVPIEIRFWRLVDKRGPDECWLWRGAKTTGPNGHGQINLGRGSDGKFKRTTAHRVAYELAYGPIPDGLFVCHRCDVRPCCNPAHLFLGTPKDNAHDMIAKGRNYPLPVGEDHPRARLTMKTAKMVKSAYAAGSTKAAIARRFGVSPETVAAVLDGRTWRAA